MTLRRVFFDTNIIIEAFRVDCWNAICGTFVVETVEKCVEETLSGNPSDPGYVAISSNELRGSLSQIHKVSNQEIATLVLDHPNFPMLDDGEQHLLARLYADDELPSPSIGISTADKATLIAVHQLGGLDNLVSLENLARQTGIGRSCLRDIRLQYQESWLGRVKTQILLEVLT